MVTQTGSNNGSSSVDVVLCVRNLSRSYTFSSKLLYEPGDIIEVKIEVNNTSAKDVADLFVSHMLRDAISYIPKTLKANKGEADMFFRVIRWRIFTLQSGDFAELSFQAKITEENILENPIIPLGASYTYKEQHAVCGTYMAKGATLENKKKNL